MKRIVFFMVLGFSFLLASSYFIKKDESPSLNLKPGVILKSADLLYKQRLDINKKIKDLKFFIDSLNKSDDIVLKSKMESLLQSKWKIMHDVGKLRREMIKFGYDLAIPGEKSKNVRYFKYIKKNIILSKNILTESEKNTKDVLQKNVDSLIDFLGIWQYEMVATKDSDGFFYLTKIKNGGKWVSKDSKDFFDNFYQWKIPAYFFKVDVSKEKRRLVKVYYNSETNILKIW